MKQKDKGTGQTNTIVRIKAKNYVCIPSEIFHDEEVSIKERGLYATIMALPDDWNFSVKGLIGILSEGEDAIRSALRGLAKHGYVTHTRIFGDNGRILGTKWTVYDHKVSYLCKEKEKPCRENPHVDNPDVENPHVDSPHVGNPAQFKNQINLKSNNTHTHTADSVPAVGDEAKDNKPNAAKQIFDNWLADKCPEAFMRLKPLTNGQADELIKLDRRNVCQLFVEINAKAMEYEGRSLYDVWMTFNNCQFKRHKKK